MFHEPAAPAGKDPVSGKDPAYLYKKRLGVWLFFLYGAVYTGFIGVNLLRPALMARIVSGGIDLAVVYGFGLIGFAILLSLFYNALCTRRERLLEERGGEPPAEDD